jgi:hypothetical protein
VICLRCRARIGYRFALSWWACACRVWATDEQTARRDQ